MTEKKVDRPKRIPVHKSKGIDAAVKPGFKRRWVTDSPGRVDMFIAAGWVPVVGSENNTSDKRAQTESQMGSVVKKVVNRDIHAGASTAVLMEIPEELFRADQAEKMREIDAIEESYDPAKRTQNGSDYGVMKKSYG